MKTSVNIKMDVEDRDAAKKLFDSLGLDMTTAVNLFVKCIFAGKGNTVSDSGRTVGCDAGTF